MKIVCLGDSLTYGYGCSRKKIWTTIAEENSGYNIINKGINGDTTGGMLSRFYQDVILQQPDVVLIMGGSNDLGVGAIQGVIHANIMSIVHQSFYNNIIPVVATLPKMNSSCIKKEWEDFAHYSNMGNSLLIYRDWIYNLGTTFGVKILDLYNLFDQKIGSQNYSLYYLDGVHFNPLGHKLMADIFLNYMNELEIGFKKMKNSNSA